jgi:hypothetical protein
MVHRFTGDDAVEWMSIMNTAVLWKQCNDGVRAPTPKFVVQPPNEPSFNVQRDPGGTRSDRPSCEACKGKGWIEKEKEKKKAAAPPEQEAPVVVQEAPAVVQEDPEKKPPPQGSLF